ncbi:MAG: hypothetical protein ACP5G1_00880 [Nanopusillaceae archaeon]
MKKSSIRNKILTALIIFSFVMVFLSIIYKYLFSPVYILKFPYIVNITENDTKIIDYAYLNITGYDLAYIYFNGILKSRNEIIITNNSNYSDYFINRIDDYIVNDSIVKANYLLYYNNLSIIYPQYVFILCIEDSCGAYKFTPVGISYALLEYALEQNNTLIIYMSKNVSEEILNVLSNRRENLLYVLYDNLKYGEIKVYNTDIIVKNLISLYSLNNNISIS